MLFEDLRQDLRHAIRTFRRTPAFTAVAVLTLAIGIGSATTLFGVFHEVLLRPLPYRHADRLGVVVAEQEFEGAARPVRARFPFEALGSWPAQGSTYDRIAFYSQEMAAVTGADTSELIDIAVVSGTFFDTMSGDLVMGRGIAPPEDLQPVAVISERLWHRLYGSDHEVLGRSVILTGRPFTIVGVAGSTFQVPLPRTDAWIPAGAFRAQNAACCGFIPIALSRPGVSNAALTQEMDGIARKLTAEVPRAPDPVRVRVESLREMIVGDTRPALLVLLAAVGLLLLLACANVANLLLARASARAHETSIRRALGAPRRRLTIQALAEGAVLTAGGGLVGVAFAAISVRALRAGLLPGLPRADSVRVDGTVLLFAFAVMAAVTVAVTLLPALQSAEVSPILKTGQRGAGGSRMGRMTFRALTIAQLAISIVLLVGAALLGRSLAALMRTDMGITPDQVATASLNLAMGRTLTDQQQIELVDRVIQRIASLPEVTAAGVGTARPPNASRMRITLNRSDDPNARAPYQAAGVPATPGYFLALGIRLERGRLFAGTDDAQAPPAVIMSADTARRLFGEIDPVGQRIGLPFVRDGKSGSEEMTVVGITANVKYSGLDQLADDVVYRPFAQQPWRSVFLVARTTGDPASLASRLRREIAAVDRAITVADVTTLDAVLSEVTAEPRFRTLLFAAFASMAIVIAAVGLYGVIAYSASQRTAEIGLRMALGADSRRIRMLVLREGLVFVVLGGGLGLTAAYGLSRLLAALLYGVAPTDPLSFAAATTGVLAAGLLASYVPAERATRVDPLVVLRAE